MSTMTVIESESSETIRERKRSRLKRIVISEHNYLALKRLGYAGDSFNDVISKLLRIERSYQEMKKQQEQRQEENNDENSSSNNTNNGSELLSPSDRYELFREQNKQQIAEVIRRLRGKRRGKCSMDSKTNKQESDK